MCWCFLRCDIMESWLSGLTFYKLSEVTICIDFYGVFFLFLALSRSRGLFKRIKFVVWLFTNMREIQNWKLNRANVWIPTTPWIFIIIFFQKSISLVFFLDFPLLHEHYYVMLQLLGLESVVRLYLIIKFVWLMIIF